MEVAGHHLVRLADLDDVIDTGHLLPGDRLEPSRIPNQTDDRVNRSAGDEGLSPSGTNPFGHGLDLRVRRAGAHDYNHPFPFLWAGPGPDTKHPGPLARGPLRPPCRRLPRA